MMRKELLCIVTLMCAIYAVGSDTLVKVEQGWLCGAKLGASTGDGYYYSFKGVPYAEPPLGTLRFKAPQPPSSWDGVRNATEHGAVCPQLNIFTNVITPGSEDCLFLNVYTQNMTPDQLFPVMVYFHGGGYQSGSGNDEQFGPDFLVIMEVVVVTINYRLGPLGFLSLESKEVPGNAGLKDQVAALLWVQKNIKQFGGDPDSVTIFGQSAGGASVGFHLISPLSNGLFTRAILMSGVPYCDFNIHYQPRRRAFKLAQLLGFETKDENKLLEFLQSVNSNDLILSSPYVIAAEEYINVFSKMYSFVPSLEINGSNSFLVEKPETILKKGNVNKADIIFGYTDKESLIALQQFEEYLLERYIKYAEMFVPTKILFKSSPDIILEISDKIRNFYFGEQNISSSLKEFIDYTSNVTFVYDIQRFFFSYPKSEGKKMFFYKFSMVSNRNIYGNQGAMYNITGAAHQDELLYLFDAKSSNLTLAKNTTEYTLVQQMTKIFTNFAKYGNPTPDSSLGVTWSEFDSTQMNYMDIGNTLAMAECPDKSDLEFWKSVLEYADIPFY